MKHNNETHHGNYHDSLSSASPLRTVDDDSYLNSSVLTVYNLSGHDSSNFSSDTVLSQNSSVVPQVLMRYAMPTINPNNVSQQNANHLSTNDGLLGSIISCSSSNSTGIVPSSSTNHEPDSSLGIKEALNELYSAVCCPNTVSDDLKLYSTGNLLNRLNPISLSSQNGSGDVYDSLTQSIADISNTNSINSLVCFLCLFLIINLC